MSSQAAARRRPKPRSRDPRSIEANDGGGVPVIKRQRTATASASPSSSSRAKTEVFGRSLSHATVKSAVCDYGVDDDEDELDEFFNRARKRTGRSGSHFGAYLDVGGAAGGGVDMGDIDDEGTVDGSDDADITATQGDSSTEHAHRKGAKAYHAAWARSNSVVSAGAKKTSFLMSSSDDDDSDDSMSLAMRRLARSKSSDKKDVKPQRRASNSPRLTPPPPVDQNKLKEIAETIERHLGAAIPGVDDTDDDPIEAVMQDKKFLTELDPDLARLVRGREAGEVRKKLKERDTARRLEEEREQQRRRAAGREELRLQDEKRRQEGSEIRQQTASQSSQTSAAAAAAASPLRPKPAAPPPASSFMQVIEVDDSSADERTQRPRRKAAIRSTYASERRRRESSSPIEAVWVVRSEGSTSAGLQASVEPAPNGFTSAAKKSSIAASQKGKQTASPAVIASQSVMPPAASRSVTPSAEEEVARLELHMKGGEGGALSKTVSVRPTTQVKKLLDHYMDVFRDSIPSNRISKVRLRFDGDTLRDTDTMEGIGIETDEQLDVIW